MQIDGDPVSSAPELARGGLALLRQADVSYGVALQERLPEIVSQAEARRVLPVVTGSLAGRPEVQAAMEGIPGRLGAFTALKPHTPFDVVTALAARIATEKPDLVMVVGGGSATDAVKVATVAAAVGAMDRESLLQIRVQPDDRGRMTSIAASRTMPVVAVPTTLSAAEHGVIAGATDTATGIKHLFRSDTLAPEFVVYDPWFARVTPMELWLSTGIRALDHGIETVLSIDANAFTDALALRGIALLRAGLPASRYNPDDPRARHLCQLGIWLCGCAIGRVRYGASHGLGHQLGAVAGVPHGLTSCVLLPAVLAFNREATEKRQQDIAAAMGKPGGSASEAVRDFIAELGLPTRMSQLSVDASTFPRIAESALGNAFVRANPRPVTTARDVLDILEQAY